MFEYKIYDEKDGTSPDNENELNYLATKGWRLVAIRPSTCHYAGFYRFYFEHEILPENEERFVKDVNNNLGI